MRSLAVLLLAVGMILSSCSKEKNWSVVDSYVTDAYKEMRDGAIGGHHRCYRVVFPVTLVFPDESTAEVGNRVELIQSLKSWKEANPDAEERPRFQFPFNIKRIGGDTIEVTSLEDIAELRAECKEHRNQHRRCRHYGRYLDNKCFQVQLPISVVMADGEVIVIEEKSDIKKVLRTWNANQPDDIPEISFPISVTVKETGEVIEIGDSEAFDALVDECKG